MNSKACVRVGNGVSDWFLVQVGLRQGCVMSPWLFNLYEVHSKSIRPMSIKGKIIYHSVILFHGSWQDPYCACVEIFTAVVHASSRLRRLECKHPGHTRRIIVLMQHVGAHRAAILPEAW